MDETIQYKIDTAILSGLAQGNEEAFTVFVHTMYKQLFPFTVSLVKSEAEADDILQEVFMKVWLHRASFTTMENPMGWVCRVVANTASNHLRAKLRHELRVKHFSTQLAATEEIEEEIDAKFMQSLIDEAVSLLPEKRKLVFLLSKKEGLSRKEIANRLKISENTVRNQLTEAIHSVHNHLSRKSGTILPLLFVVQCFLEIFFEQQ